MSGSSGKVFFGCVEPDAVYRQGQHLWIDTNDGNKPKRWNGLAWIVVTDKAATDAVAGAKAALSQLGSKAEAHAVSALTTRVAADSGPRSAEINSEAIRIHSPTGEVTIGGLDKGESSSLAIDLGQAIEPLRMGGVTFYGESARVIRDAQVVLKAAGAGQLEVVKRANEPGEPFVVIEGQVFINEAAIKSTTFEVKVVRGTNGHYHAAGFGLGLERTADKTATAPIDADQVLSDITKQISESALGADLASRIAEIEKARLKQGAENRAINDRLTNLELDLLRLKTSLAITPNQPKPE